MASRLSSTIGSTFDPNKAKDLGFHDGVVKFLRNEERADKIMAAHGDKPRHTFQGSDTRSSLELIAQFVSPSGSFSYGRAYDPYTGDRLSEPGTFSRPQRRVLSSRSGPMTTSNGQAVFTGVEGGKWVMENGEWKPFRGDLSGSSRGAVDPMVSALLGRLDELESAVSTGSMLARAGITPQGGATDVAQGFDLQQQMFQNLLSANADRRATVDQTISVINLLAELERVSPTRAAEFASALGMGDGPDLGFVNEIDSGALARISGTAGNQSISLPLSLSGRSLDFLGNNPSVANVVQDVADAIGLPDIFRRSGASAIPTSRSLIGLAG